MSHAAPPAAPEPRVRLWVVFPVAVFLLVGFAVRAAIHRAPAAEEASEPAGAEHPGEGDPLDLAWKKKIEELRKKPESRALLGESSEQAEAVDTIRSLSTTGNQRLPDDALLRRVSLLTTLVGRVDLETCAAIFRNSATSEQLHAAFLKLDPDGLDAWVDLTVRAAQAELAQTEAPTVSEDDTKNATNALVNALPPEDGKRLATVLADVPASSDDDACWAARTLYAKVPKMGEPYDRIIARGLVQY